MVPTLRSILKKRLGNLSVRALKGMRYAWKRWKEHTMECRILLENLYGGRGTRSPIHTVCFPISSLFRTPFTEEQNGRGRGTYSAGRVRQSPGLGFPNG